MLLRAVHDRNASGIVCLHCSATCSLQLNWSLVTGDRGHGDKSLWHMQTQYLHKSIAKFCRQFSTFFLFSSCTSRLTFCRPNAASLKLRGSFARSESSISYFAVVLWTFILWLGNETLTTFAYIDMKLALSLFNGFLQSLLYFPKMKIMFPNYLETSETFYQLSEIFILPLQIFWHKPLTWLWLNLCYFNVLSLSGWTWPSEWPAVIN